MGGEGMERKNDVGRGEDAGRPCFALTRSRFEKRASATSSGGPFIAFFTRRIARERREYRRNLSRADSKTDSRSRIVRIAPQQQSDRFEEAVIRPPICLYAILHTEEQLELGFSPLPSTRIISPFFSFLLQSSRRFSSSNGTGNKELRSNERSGLSAVSDSPGRE